MKRYFFLLGIAAIIVTSFTSCATYKRDCQGGRHTRLKNGVVI